MPGRFFKKIAVSTLTALVLFAAVCPAFAKAAESLEKALALEKSAYYSEAIKVYERAAREAGRENNCEMLTRANHRIKQIEKIMLDYPFSRKEAEKQLAKALPKIDAKQRASFFDSKKIDDFMIIDGEPHYHQKFAANLLFRDNQLYDLAVTSKSKAYFGALYDIIFRPSDAGFKPDPAIPNINPFEFLGTQTFKVARAKLPKSGLLQLWFPMPVMTSAQSDVRVIAMTPQKYLKALPKTDVDIALAYFEVPLETLDQDLNIEIKFMFKRYEQRFIIDPANCGEYDVESPLYKKYTRSNKNTAITPEIKAKAESIVAGERNPYLAAKKIYDYIVNNVEYSFMPHLALGVLEKPESVFVHEHGYGDCGAQSMYFAALCRSIGIPAKSSGGYQLVPGFAGPHFWAEFYLSNYGWVPVDTSIAQTVDRSIGATNMQKKRFKEYFFGNMDPYRYNIQRETDALVTPMASDPVFLPLAVQSPIINLKGSRRNMELELLDYWKQDINPVY